MRAVLIFNPVAGVDGGNQDGLEALRQSTRGLPFEVELCSTSLEVGAGPLARSAVERGFEVVLVAGGDGTVSEVARELVSTPATLGILPVGTFNNIARSIGVLAEPKQAMEVIAAGHTRAIDVGLANGGDYFFEAAGSGLDATLFPLGEEMKSGRWYRIWQIAKLTVQYTPQRFRIEFPHPLSEVLSAAQLKKLRRRERAGKVLYRKALFVVAANGPYYGGGFTVAADARMRDGHLTVSIYRRFSKWELLRHFYSISRGQYHYSPKIETYHVERVVLDAKEATPVHLDGRPYGSTPVDLAAVKGALRVFAPKDPSIIPSRDPAVALPAPANRDAEPVEAR